MTLKLISILIISACFSVQSMAEQSNNPSVLSTDNKIQRLLSVEKQNTALEFPYRMNLFTQGQTNKNNAGIRVAETANQVFENNSGLLFYYVLMTDAMRVPHWHANATEVGTVLDGKMRVTIWEGTGTTKVFTVEKNGTWIIPKAKLHALENIGEGKIQFIVGYDSPIAADRDFITAWASLPNAILARAVGLSEADLVNIKKVTINRLSKFDPAAKPMVADITSELSNSFSTDAPLFQSELGSIARIDPQRNLNIQKMALQRTIMKPGVLRIPHWYTSGDVLLFVLHGNAFFTMMNDEGKIYHALVQPGDLISIPVGNFHGFLNIGRENLETYELFNHADDIQEITLMNGVQHFSMGSMEATTGLNENLIEKINKEKSESYMMQF